jgi:biofilm PGA synthesis N-glycosyltransferase PgaC
MLKNILFYMFISVGMLNLVHFAFYLVGGNFYDIWQFRRSSKSRKNGQKERRFNPLVSVVIPAYNESKGIERTLDSIMLSEYRNIEVIVINDGSTDDTSRVVRRYIERRNKFTIKARYARRGRKGEIKRTFVRQPSQKGIKITLVNQPNEGKGAAVNNGIKNHAKGSLVMTLDGDSILHPTTIKNAVAYFKSPKIVGVAANVRIMDSHTLIGILQKFEHMIGYRSKKFYTLSNSEFIVGGVASTYRRSVLKKVGYYDTDTLTEDIGLSMKIIATLGNRGARIIYAADVVAGTEGVRSYRALFKQRYRWKMGMLQNLYRYRKMIASNDANYGRVLTMYRLPLAFLSELILLVEPIILGYVIYLSILYHNPSAIVGAYVTITLYVLMTLWPDEHSTPKAKLQQSLIAPCMYFVFYVMNAVQIVSIIRCIKNYKQVTLKEKTGGKWTPVERTGGRQVQYS